MKPGLDRLTEVPTLKADRRDPASGTRSGRRSPPQLSEQGDAESCSGDALPEQRHSVTGQVVECYRPPGEG